jgi:hypothetical protein
MAGLNWTGPNPFLVPPWPGTTAWDEPRNWGLSGVPPNDYYPTNANGLVAAFFSSTIPGLTGPCQTTDLRVYFGAGQVSFADQFDGTSGTQVYLEGDNLGNKGEVEFQGGVIGDFFVAFAGGNFGASGTKVGPGFTLETTLVSSPAGGSLGAGLFTAEVEDSVIKHLANGVEVAFVGPVTGSALLQCGPDVGTVPPSVQYGEGSQVTLNAANTFTGTIVASTFNGSRRTNNPKVNLQNALAAGAAGNTIRIVGGTLTQNGYAIPWSAYTLSLENTVRITALTGNDLEYYLPDERNDLGGNIKGSGANWSIKCHIDVQELSGEAAIGFTDGFTAGGVTVPPGNTDNIDVTALGILNTRQTFPCHVFGNLSFSGGKVLF